MEARQAPQRSFRGAGCLCGMLGGVIGFVVGIRIDMRIADEMRAKGELVDFLPGMPLVGLFLGGCLGVVFGILLNAILRSRRSE